MYVLESATAMPPVAHGLSLAPSNSANTDTALTQVPSPIGRATIANGRPTKKTRAVPGACSL